MTREEAVQFIEQQRKNGHFFAVKFIKRTTQEVREMNCRFGVTQHLQGGELNYSPQEKQLFIVYDMVKRGYRTIPVEGIVAVKIGGTWQNVEN